MAVHNNVFVHSNPPKAIVSGQSAAIKNWAKNGEVDKLEKLVLDGQGARLLGLMDSASDPKVRGFLRSIPGYMAKVDLIHDAIIRGSLRETQALLDKKKLATAKDAVGRSLTHKAVLYNHKQIVEWLGKKFPESLHLKDLEQRNCLHYCAACKDPEEMYDLVVSLGGNPNQVDIHGRRPGYYLENPDELGIERPRSFSRGSKRRISPLSYPKSSKYSFSTRTSVYKTTTRWFQNGKYKYNFAVSPTGVITRAQIRIWIHERDISSLEKIVFSGNGDKLLLETSNNSRVRKFLDNVPHILSIIKSVHSAAIQNDVQAMQDIKKRTNGISEVFQAKDSHMLTPLHKAAGLGNRVVSEFLLFESPSTINEVDGDGRTPIFYSAPLRDTTLYNTLLRHGADPGIVDIRGKTADYYRTHPNELDGRYLRHIPDAPRVNGSPTGWDRYSPGGEREEARKQRRVSSGSFSGGGGLLEAADEEIENPVNAQVEEEEPKVNGFAEPEIPETIETPAESEPLKNEEEEIPESENLLQEPNERAEITPPPPQDPSEEIQAQEENEIIEKDTFAIADEPPPPPQDEGQIEENDIITTKYSSKYRRATSSNNMTANDENQEIPAPDESDTQGETNQEAETEAEGEPTVDGQEQTEAEQEQEEEEEAENNEMELVNDEGEEDELLLKFEDEEEEEQVQQSDIQIEPDRTEIAGNEETNEPETEPKSDPDELPPQEPEGGEDGETVIPAQNGSPREENVDTWIEEGDMEKLVDQVLEGKGSSLLGRQSSIPEVQEFLSNVPAYMAKIDSIHAAAGTGNLRDLQSLLDRKRLALARDEMGRCPLHKAVLYNHTNVVRYLATNFPLSLQVQDYNGRTPLHYSATLSAQDKGNLYKVLIQSGSNPNLRDAMNNTAGIYLRNKELLKHSDLLPKKKTEIWERPPSPPSPSHGHGPSSLPSTSAGAPEREVTLKETDIPIVDIPSKFVKQLRIRLSRNIRHFPFVSTMSSEDLQEVNSILKEVGGPEFDWVDLESLEKEKLQLDWMPDATKVSRFWPKSRSFAIRDNLLLWINGMDHLDFVIQSSYGKFYPILKQLHSIYHQFDGLDYYWTQADGFQTVNPLNSGTGMKITFRIRLPNLMKDAQELQAKCMEMRLFLRWRDNKPERNGDIHPEDWIELENIRTVGNEIDIAREMSFCVNKLIELDEKIARSIEEAQFPAIWSEEGKYLANVLGSALVQGLTQVSTLRPADPIGYLANFLKSYKDKDGNSVIDKRTAEALATAHATSSLARATSTEETDFFDNNKGNEQKSPNNPVFAEEEEARRNSVERVNLGESNITVNEGGLSSGGASGTKVNEPEEQEQTQSPIANQSSGNAEDGEEEEEALEQQNKENPGESSPPPAYLEAEKVEKVEESAQGTLDATVEEVLPPTDPESEEITYNVERNEGSESIGNPIKVKRANSSDSIYESHSQSEEDELVKKLEVDMDQSDIEAIQEKDEPEEPEDIIEEGMSQRDEHGQSVLHFTASRPGAAQTLHAFLTNPTVNLGWKDENLRTAREVAEYYGRNENVAIIDKWLISTAIAGEVETLQKLMIDGYDGFYVMDNNQVSIQELVERAEQPAVLLFLNSIDDFRQRLEKLHRSVRNGGLQQVKELLRKDPRLAIAIGKIGRTALHIAVLSEEFAIAHYIASHHPESLRRGDNLNKLPLHMAMGTDKVEKMARILVRAGARRVVKDLKGRQPSYYYANRNEIVRLQSEEAKLRAAQNQN